MCSYGQLVHNLMQLDLSVLFSICSVHFSHSVVSFSLQRLGLQLARLPYASPELAQAHVHRLGDAIQPSHPLSSHSPPAFNLS